MKFTVIVKRVDIRVVGNRGENHGRTVDELISSVPNFTVDFREKFPFCKNYVLVCQVILPLVVL